ncbi:MAG: OmpA family protein, partial [Verrucomicrobiota bacterium]|nr:OmpA family protein [Verrucomicrobiota bacterium]
VKSAKQPIINLPKPAKRAGSGLGDSEGIPGMRSLDEALATTGPLPAGGKVGMPGGALFEYDKADLRPEAIDDLQKLGEIIRRNPRASFNIEGHTDSFGAHEYNLELSKRRADAVKSWLVQNFGVRPERIQTIGFGSTKLLVPAARSIEEQAPNRRVEIVVKTRPR